MGAFSAYVTSRVPQSCQEPRAKSGKCCSFGTRSAESERVEIWGKISSTTQPRFNRRAHALRPVDMDAIQVSGDAQTSFVITSWLPQVLICSPRINSIASRAPQSYDFTWKKATGEFSRLVMGKLSAIPRGLARGPVLILYIFDASLQQMYITTSFSRSSSQHEAFISSLLGFSCPPHNIYTHRM
jgi:hypothetical protein